MKKILKSALALFLVLAICAPEVFVTSAEGGRTWNGNFSPNPKGNAKAIQTRHQIITCHKKQKPLPQEQQNTLEQTLQNPSEQDPVNTSEQDQLNALVKELAAQKAQNEALIKEVSLLRRLLPASPTPKLLADTYFMCICPTPAEFMAVYNSLCNSGDFEVCFDGDSKKIEGIYTSEQKDKFVKNLRSMDRRISTLFWAKYTNPGAIFVNIKSGKKVCLAWSDKGVFDAPMHILDNFNIGEALIFGIGACTDETIKIGSVFWPQKYVNVKILGMGKHRRRDKIFLKFHKFYIREKDVDRASCKIDKVFLDQLGQHVGVEIQTGTSFSLPVFIADEQASRKISNKLEDKKVIIDMEGGSIFKQFKGKKIMINSIRVVSDHGSDLEEFNKGGKKNALSRMIEIAASAIDFLINRETPKQGSRQGSSSNSRLTRAKSMSDLPRSAASPHPSAN